MKTFCLAFFLVVSLMFGCTITEPVPNYYGQPISGAISTNKEIIGSGFAISDSVCVTAYHVLEGETKPFYVNRHPAKLVYVNPTLDFALFEVPNHSLKILNMGMAEVGTRADAVGWINMPDNSSICIMTRGYVSGRSKALGLISFDGGLQAGMSGGPLLNAKSELIGMNQHIITMSINGAPGLYSPNPTMGFALESDIIKNVFVQLVYPLEEVELEHSLQLDIVRSSETFLTPDTFKKEAE